MSQLNKDLFLTSANSINVARWLPQQFYYFYAFRQWPDKTNLPVISVPSGNFGNLCAGIVANLTGLPVQHFIAAVNANDSVYKYLQTGTYESQAAVATLSNAMDVGNPSNFVRILELFQHQFPQVSSAVSSYSITDAETRTTLRETFDRYAYLPDPHGAVAIAALQKYQQANPHAKGVVLETAHPVKFYDIVESVTGSPVARPDNIDVLLGREKKSIRMEPDYRAFKDFLLS